MSRRPPSTAVPHRVSTFAFRAARVHDPAGNVVGHLLVLPNVYWRRVRGWLWWSTWGDPIVAAEVFDVVEDDFEDGFYFGESLDALIRDWDRDRWAERDVVYSTEWLDDAVSAGVAHHVFGVDLAKERRERGPAVA